jgi:hypothetical protein
MGARNRLSSEFHQRWGGGLRLRLQSAYGLGFDPTIAALPLQASPHDEIDADADSQPKGRAHGFDSFIGCVAPAEKLEYLSSHAHYKNVDNDEGHYSDDLIHKRLLIRPRDWFVCDSIGW